MGARGPVKLPTHLRPVSDARLANTVAEVAPKAAPEKPKAVEDDSELSDMWDSLVPLLDSAGMLSPSDALVIEMALRHVVAGRRAYEVLDVEGPTISDAAIAGGVKKHPAEVVFRSESEMFLRYAQQLGMTFVSRARTPTSKAGVGDGDSNPFSSPAVG